MKAETERKRSESETGEKLAGAAMDRDRVGQYMAYSLAILCVVGSIVFFAVGIPIAGAVLLGLPVVQLIQTFFRGKQG